MRPIDNPANGPLPSGVHLLVKAVPGASRSRIVGWLGDHLKVAVAAPPEGGKANKAICQVLADALGVRAQDVQVVAGASNPRKKVFIAGLTADQARQRLG